MNRTQLIKLKANLKSCINIGVSKPIKHLLNLCITTIEDSLYKEDKPIIDTMADHSHTDYSNYASCPNCGTPDGDCNC